MISQINITYLWTNHKWDIPLFLLPQHPHKPINFSLINHTVYSTDIPQFTKVIRSIKTVEWKFVNWKLYSHYFTCKSWRFVYESKRKSPSVTCLWYLLLQIKLYYPVHVYFLTADAMQRCSLCIMWTKPLSHTSL
jgi:hypothetical protein